MAYTTQAKVEGYLGRSINATFFATALTWVKQWIDNYVGSTFESASSTRYFDSKGGDCLIIDPLTAITSLDILDIDGTVAETLTEGPSNDFLLYPLNATEKYEVRLLNRHFPKRIRSVKIVGTFGSSTSVPADVEMVATKLIGAVVSNGGTGNITSEKLGDYELSYGTIDEKAQALGVTNTLDHYRHIEI